MQNAALDIFKYFTMPKLKIYGFIKKIMCRKTLQTCEEIFCCWVFN